MCDKGVSAVVEIEESYKTKETKRDKIRDTASNNTQYLKLKCNGNPYPQHVPTKSTTHDP